MMHQEFLDFNEDLNDICLAILFAAYYGNVEFSFNTDEQYCKHVDFYNKYFDSYMNYYYAYGDNYLEFDEYSEVSTAQVLDGYYDKNGEKTTVTYEIISFEKLKQVIDSYLKKYEKDDLVGEGNLLTFNAQNERLYKLLTEKEYNLFYFHVTDISYMKPICYAFHKNLISVSDIKIEFDEDSNITLFDFHADFTRYVDYMKNKDKENMQKSKDKKNLIKSKKRRKYFSPSVQDLFNYLKTYAPAKDFIIYPIDLIGDRSNKLYENMGTLTTMVNRLNEQYREITHDETVTIMKYDKYSECYVITDVWNN